MWRAPRWAVERRERGDRAELALLLREDSRLYRTPVKNSDSSRASALSNRFHVSNPEPPFSVWNSFSLVRFVRALSSASSMSAMVSPSTFSRIAASGNLRRRRRIAPSQYRSERTAQC